VDSKLQIPDISYDEGTGFDHAIARFDHFLSGSAEPECLKGIRSPLNRENRALLRCSGPKLTFSGALQSNKRRE
jgi:hypothetical protein